MYQNSITQKLHIPSVNVSTGIFKTNNTPGKITQNINPLI